jgi:hypothetical protein
MTNLYIGLSKNIKDKSIYFVFIFLLSGCALVGHKDNSEAMYIKASALTKLSAAVEGTVRYQSPPDTLSDQELLKLSTEDDPSLLEPFTGYVLKVNREFNHAIVLVCNSDGTRGLLEDAGCTAAMDNHLWQKNVPCTFTLRSDVVCP